MRERTFPVTNKGLLLEAQPRTIPPCALILPKGKKHYECVPLSEIVDTGCESTLLKWTTE